jgi:bacillopeptidase F
VTAGAGGSLKCWATNLTGVYVADTDTSLRSPVIDLSAVSGATLSFARSIDAAAGHTLTVNVIAADSDTVIANVIPAAEDPNGGESPWQTIGPVELPAGALGQSVRIEWRFVGNGDEAYNGVYIDNVVVTPTP